MVASTDWAVFVRRKGNLHRDELGMTACARAVIAIPELAKESLFIAAVSTGTASLQFSCYRSRAASKMENLSAYRGALRDEPRAVRDLYFRVGYLRSRSCLRSGFFWRQLVSVHGGSKVQCSADLC